MANVKIIYETPKKHTPGQWQLCFQWCEYHFDDDSIENGYQFIWRRPDGTLQAARGQTRIMSVDQWKRWLPQKNVKAWGNLKAES